MGSKRHVITKLPVKSTDQWLGWRREDVITASVIAALFGLHPRQTIYGLFHQANGLIVPDESNDAIERGHDFEDVIAKRFNRRHPTWKVIRPRTYFRDTLRRIGGTPDFFIKRPDVHGRGVLECKSVAPHVFRKYWTETTPPMWVTLQTLCYMMLTHATYGYVAALIADGFRYELHEYEIHRNASAERRIHEAVDDFWHHVSIGKTPNPDYSRDGALIAMMNPVTTEGTTIDLRHDNHLPDLLDERARLKQQMDDARKRCEAIDAELKHKMGDAEAALINGWRVTCREVHKKEFTVGATSYRQLRAVRDETFRAEAVEKDSAA
jgi:predicted phage-related endonuclease